MNRCARRKILLIVILFFSFDMDYPLLAREQSQQAPFDSATHFHSSFFDFAPSPTLQKTPNNINSPSSVNPSHKFAPAATAAKERELEKTRQEEKEEKEEEEDEEKEEVDHWFPTDTNTSTSKSHSVPLFAISDEKGIEHGSTLKESPFASSSSFPTDTGIDPGNNNNDFSFVV